MSAPLRRVPNGGFITTVSARSASPLTSSTRHWIVSTNKSSNPSQFSWATSSALASMSTPTTCPAPNKTAAIPRTPQPHPRSTTTFSSTSPLLMAAYIIWEARCAPVGYCSRSTLGLRNTSTSSSIDCKCFNFIPMRILRKANDNQLCGAIIASAAPHLRSGLPLTTGYLEAYENTRGAGCSGNRCTNMLNKSESEVFVALRKHAIRMYAWALSRCRASWLWKGHARCWHKMSNLVS
mmetsp:Transcript_35459/g.67917  ORF Transcript_35459/g.67917 Transcript_35459/m.67917 type:complete len:237 (+) Transcript_35459:414-1124(+)